MLSILLLIHLSIAAIVTSSSVATSRTKANICGTYTIPCLKEGITYSYIFHGKTNKMLTDLELIITNYKEKECKTIRMVTRKVYDLQAYDYTMYSKEVVAKLEFHVKNIYLAFNKPVVADTVKCTIDYQYMKEFDILDHSCEDQDPFFDYKALVSEVDSMVPMNLLFRSNDFMNKDTDQIVKRSETGGCITFWDTYRVLIQILVLFFIILVLLLIANCIYMKGRNKRRFLTLDKNDRYNRDIDPTFGSYLFTLNTYDRVQTQL